ncbi:MAG: hypothetical protein ACLU48_04490 [Clostridiaceae bacterium]
MVRTAFGAAIVRSYGDTRPTYYRALSMSGVRTCIILNLLRPAIGFHPGLRALPPSSATVISGVVSTFLIISHLRTARRC